MVKVAKLSKRPRVSTSAFRIAASVALACAFAAPSAAARYSTTQEFQTRLSLLAAVAPGEEDTDGDGIPDNMDACKRVKGVASDTPRLNGCPPAVDTDGDGVADDNDACPKKAGVASTDPKLNGCPPPPPPRDRDGDGVPDSDDACPWKKGVASDDPKRNGCPESAAKALATPRSTSSAKASARVSTAAGGAAELTFSGFHSFDDGTSEVFVELSGPVTINQRVGLKAGKGKADSTIVYTLENTKVPRRNNKNPLNATEFPSVLRRATITQKKKAVELTITLKAPVQAATQMVQRDGKTVFEIRLPRAP
jgi:Thrombospondin type 3 repeat